MDSSTVFEVAEVHDLAQSDAVELRGRIRRGAAAEGMTVLVLIDGGLYMSAPIRQLRSTPHDVDEVWLTLDVP